MANTENNLPNTENIDPNIEKNPQQLEGGTYEVIKSRLNKQADDLRSRLQKLNIARKEVFGAVELKLIGNARINTENNCLAKDIFAIGKYCLFGYNVHIGLRSEMQVKDVFSVFELQNEQFKPQPLDWLCKDNPRFVEDFQNLYKYYKEAVFVKFAIEQAQPYVYMMFQLSKDINDVKFFKWEIRDNSLKYVTEAGEHKYKYPNQYDFEWKKTSREQFRQGKHPHVSILDRVFVETVGGDLTIKVEDNTETGKGIYAEMVNNPDQRLDDSEIYYADLGNLIALKIRPYQEEFRYFLFNEKMQTALRIDALAQAGIRLAAEQGLLFSNGYYLQTGDYKLFDKSNVLGFKYERKISSPNGEDYLYVYYSIDKATYLLLSYNIISQTIATPIYCNGFTLYPQGELTYFKSEENANKHHIIQIWQTPYLEGDFIPSTQSDSFLYKVGNRDIVRAMAETQELLSMLGKDDNYSGLYYDLSKKANDILDSYYWINNKDSFLLNEPLLEIRKSAAAAIDEFEKVQNIKKATRLTIQQTEQAALDLFKQIGQTSFNRTDIFVQTLAQLRQLRGEIISLKELRYADPNLINNLEQKTVENTNTLSQECVVFLLRPDALNPYIERTEEARKAIEGIETAKQGKQIEEKIDNIGKELELLVEIVTNLKIEDPTQTTKIIDAITSLFSALNQVKAGVKRRLRDLTGAEAVSEFAAQIRLLEQAMLNFLDLADNPVKADEYLTKLMVQIEEIESKFAEFDEFTARISEKREEIYNAFNTRKLQLVEAINKKAASLQTAAERILNGVKNRAFAFKQVNEINGFFAADMMIEKVREIIEQLNTIGDSNKAGDIQTQLKTIKEEAVRQLRDKQDLYTAGGDAIKLGRHSFSVNKQTLDLTMLGKNGEMFFHLTGTAFFEQVDNPEFLKTRPVWEQSIVSENNQIYRSEYLAYLCFKQLQLDKKQLRSDEILNYVQQFAAPRYQEGYSKGIHDEDAAKLLNIINQIAQGIDLLYFSPTVRSCANLFWSRFLPDEDKNLFQKQLKSAGLMLRIFPNSKEFKFVLDNLQAQIADFIKNTGLFSIEIAKLAAEYLFSETAKRDYFIVSGDSYQLKKDFKAFLDTNAALKLFNDNLTSLANQPVELYQLSRKWLFSFVEQSQNIDYLPYIDETALLLISNTVKEFQIISLKTKQQLPNLFGTHQVVKEGGIYEFEFNQFMRKMELYVQNVVPMFENYQLLKKQLTDSFKQQLRLEEFRPRPLTSFVRNKLIDNVYIPLFGDNFAKQLGTVGDTSRTDRMGMLLLISPPGYGKTTLIEYIANRLGLIFMKINGPALGHTITSVDPKDADNASARKELEKLNLALEMSDNVMLYIDDIQHCNPEFLQKFISLTDGQRKIEGVYNGVAKTYDLRGKRFCVAMAGNPYTESGEKFKIPDMLANRSDIYNLGDIIGDTKEVFEMSYIENAMASNPVLQKLAAKSTKDLYPLIKYAQTDSKEGLDFEANHSPQELSEYAEVLKKMMQVRDTLLKVNLEYIRSAAMADEYRNEPTFKLQGSYRNMGKLAEKIVSVMNEKEISTLVVSHYEGESQTLTSGAESNMLKLKEMMGVQTEENKARWKEIKSTFLKNKLINGDESDPVVQVVAQLSHFSDNLKQIQEVLQLGVEQAASLATQTPKIVNNAPKFTKK
jgi:MoxR-like ATPase/flagellin-specific chaperone FliS